MHRFNIVSVVVIIFISLGTPGYTDLRDMYVHIFFYLQSQIKDRPVSTNKDRDSLITLFSKVMKFKVISKDNVSQRFSRMLENSSRTIHRRGWLLFPVSVM